VSIFDFLSKAFGPKDVPLVPTMPEAPKQAELPANSAPIVKVSKDDVSIFPERSPQALGGKAFLESIKDLGILRRDQLIRDEIINGNVPSFMRKMVEVQVEDLTLYCTPDYLCIGSDDDFVSVPMSYDHASIIAKTLKCHLPTRKMVDKIFAASKQHLPPQPLPPTADMPTTGYVLHQNELIEAKKAQYGYKNGVLLAGHKKDIVISAKYPFNPGKEAIYGWHQLNGMPIQPLSFAHDTHYLDYSHGARLILDSVKINGAWYPTKDVLTMPALCHYLSDEGPVNM